MNDEQAFHLPNCHNCLQSALYQLEHQHNITAAITAIKAAQRSLEILRNIQSAVELQTTSNRAMD